MSVNGILSPSANNFSLHTVAPQQQQYDQLNLNAVQHSTVNPLPFVVNGGNISTAVDGNELGVVHSRHHQQSYFSAPSSSANDYRSIHVPPYEKEEEENLSWSMRNKTNYSKSTLSMHLAAYTPYIAAEAVRIEERIAKQKPRNGEKFIERFRRFFNGPPVHPSFEIPRQQKDVDSTPEIMNFKPSQRLASPDEQQRAADVEYVAQIIRANDADAAAVDPSQFRRPSVFAGDLPAEDNDLQIVDVADELAEMLNTQTPKRKRKTRKSQDTKARIRSTQEKNKRAQKNANEEMQDESSTPHGRTSKLQRVQQVTPYPSQSSKRAVQQPVSPLRPLPSKQKSNAGRYQVISDVVQIPCGLVDPSITQRALPPVNVRGEEEEDHGEYGVRMDADGVLHIDDEEAIRQRDIVLQLDEIRINDDEEANPVQLDNNDGVDPAAAVLQINDIDNVQPIRPADQRPYLPNEANLSGVNFTSDECLNAIRRQPDAFLSGELLTAFHCGYIPHHSFNIFNQISFLDPAWQRNPHIPITKFLRVHSERPELIIAHLHVRGNHWTVLLINTLTNQAKYYDPLMKWWITGFETRVQLAEKDLCLRLLQRLRDADVIGDTELIKAEYTEFNQQTNGWSCAYMGIILAEDVAEFGFTRRWEQIDIELERNRINRTIHALAILNRTPPDDDNQRSKRTLEIWPPRPPRENWQVRAYQVHLQSQASELADDNSLIQQIPAKAPVKAVIRPPQRRSVRIMNQHKPRHPALVAMDLRSLQVRGIPPGRDDSNIFPDVYDLGPMNKQCTHCKAFHFEPEKCNKCCGGGTVPTPPIHPIPAEMELLRAMPEFWKKIRIYNSLFAMVSNSTNVKWNDGAFKIQGEPRYNVGDLIPRPGQTERYVQIYTVDGDQAVQNRRLQDLRNMGFNGNADDVSRDCLGLIERMIRTHHPIAQELMTMREQMIQEEEACERDGREMKRMYIVWEDPVKAGSAGVHPGRLNAPNMQGQIFQLYRSDDGAPPPNGIYFGFQKGGSNSIRRVPTFSGNLDPAAFPLIFYYGDPGWTPGIPKLNKTVVGAEEDAAMEVDGGDEQLDAAVVDEADGEEEEDVFNGQDFGPEENDEYDENDAEDMLACSSDEDIAEQKQKTVSKNEFVRARLFDRTKSEKNDFNAITGARQLFQHWVIHSAISINQQRLEWQEKICDQNALRYEQCQTLRDALQRLMDKDPALKGKKLGKVKLMRKNYRGGKPYMQKKFRDGIAISTRYGKDDLFITFTGNPNWREIQENLRHGENWIDRPDLVCRVFNLKAAEFLKDILKRGVLGKVISHKVVLEHQKRGMPHLHILICLKKEYKLDTVEKIDNILCSMLPPEPEEDDEHYLAKRRYYDYVMLMMIHDPSRCAVFCGKGKKEGICKKGYPKDNRENTFIKSDGYAQVKRPDDLRVVTLQKNLRHQIQVTNRWVVQHNRYLLLKYNCHINIEHCGGSKAIKYLHKYLHKGHDRAFITVREQVSAPDPNVPPALDDNGNPIETADYNEFAQTRQLACISAAEAVERIYSMFITKQSHTVYELPVHLPGEHNVTFKESDDAAKLDMLTSNDGTSNNARAVSQLTALFKLVANEKADPDIDQTDPTRSMNLFFHQIPEYYHWTATKWKRRQRNRKTIGRLQSVYPSNVERFCLRELLKDIEGPTCYEDLKKDKDGKSYPTFREAAVARGLFMDDGSSRRTLKEVCSYAMPKQCRQTFAMILLYHQPENPKALWDRFRRDFWSRTPGLTNAQRERRALAHVASILYHHNTTMAQVKMYEVTELELHQAINRSFTRIETDGNHRYQTLNELQKFFTDAVFQSLDDPTDGNRKRLFFLQAGGGCGKTHVFNTIIRILIQNRYKVVSVASTGIAAVLLDNGQTAHSAFRIPLDLSKPISLSATNRRAELIRDADVFIWDEAPMQNKVILDKAQQQIKELAANLDDGSRKFANKTMILGGDFKQLLPVVKHETIRASFEASLLCSKLFIENFNVYTLEENVRAQEDPEYAEWCKAIGNGKMCSAFAPNAVQIPFDIADPDEISVVNSVFPTEIFNYVHTDWDRYVAAVKDNAVLSPLNEKVTELNALLTSKLKGAAKTYTAINHLPEVALPGDEFIREQYDSDALNGFEHASIPPHSLTLRIGSVVMLSRNLDTNHGLCNGTRMIVKKMFDDHVLCQVITGKAAGQEIPIFSIKNTYEDVDEEWPAFVRIQLPLRPAFAITINKSQGQTLAKVGLILDAQCFAHGQFYVAVTRVRKRQDIKIYVPPNMWGIEVGGDRRIPHAINVVLPEVILELRELISKTTRPVPIVPPPPPPRQPSPPPSQQPAFTHASLTARLSLMIQRNSQQAAERSIRQHQLMRRRIQSSAPPQLLPVQSQQPSQEVRRVPLPTQETPSQQEQYPTLEMNQYALDLLQWQMLAQPRLTPYDIHQHHVLMHKLFLQTAPPRLLPPQHRHLYRAPPPPPPPQPPSQQQPPPAPPSLPTIRRKRQSPEDFLLNGSQSYRPMSPLPDDDGMFPVAYSPLPSDEDDFMQDLQDPPSPQQQPQPQHSSISSQQQQSQKICRLLQELYNKAQWLLSQEDQQPLQQLLPLQQQQLPHETRQFLLLLSNMSQLLPTQAQQPVSQFQRVVCFLYQLSQHSNTLLTQFPLTQPQPSLQQNPQLVHLFLLRISELSQELLSPLPQVLPVQQPQQ